jgi:hypothetical protein
MAKSTRGTSTLLVLAALGCHREERPIAPLPVESKPDAAPDNRVTDLDVRFIPALGGAPVLSRVGPGEYLAAISTEKSQYPTMEIYIHDASDGRARLVLDPSGKAEACFANHTSHHYSKSKYASSSGKYESSNDERWILVGGRGTFGPRPGGALEVRLTLMRNACPPPEVIEPGTTLGNITLVCARIEANETLASPIVACTSKKEESWLLDDLALELAETEPHEWLLLGAAPGLEVKRRPIGTR